MNIDPISEARRRRESSAVAFAKFLEIQSTDSSVPIAAIEGRDDIGVWAVWITRSGYDGPLELLPCGGKEKVFELRNIIKHNKRIKSQKIMFFVDRDYDDWAGHEAEPNTFMTDRYAIENYFVCDRVVDHVLDVNFLCAGKTAEKVAVRQVFNTSFDVYRSAATDLHLKTFFLRKLRVNTGISLPTQFKEIVKIDDQLKFSPQADSDCKVQLPSDICPDSIAALSAEFAQYPFLERARGKYHRAFMNYFFSVLQCERNPANRSIFPAAKSQSDFKFSSLNIVECAGVSFMPLGLSDFVKRNLHVP